MRVCAVDEDPEFDNCTLASASSAPLNNLCVPGDATCLMTGKPALNLIKRPEGILDNPIVLIGAVVALIVWMKR